MTMWLTDLLHQYLQPLVLSVFSSSIVRDPFLVLLGANSMDCMIHAYQYLIMAQKDRKKNLSEYEQLKQKRTSNLIQEFQQYINSLQRIAASKVVNHCQKYANRMGQYDQIDEQVCLRDRCLLIDNRLTKVLPQLSQHAINYEQCMAQCERNSIGYIIADQSCRTVYEKNFKKAIESIQQKLKKDNVI